MLSRVKDPDSGIVHFINPAHKGQTLCGESNGMDLLGNWLPLGKSTSELVTCAGCAKTVCAIRNEPYNTLDASVDDATMTAGIYAAVQPPGPVEKTQNEDIEHETVLRNAKAVQDGE